MSLQQYFSHFETMTLSMVSVEIVHGLSGLMDSVDIVHGPLLQYSSPTMSTESMDFLQIGEDMFKEFGGQTMEAYLYYNLTSEPSLR